MSKRARRSFTAEFKAEAVALARQGEKSVGQLARDLDLTETALREWIRKADGERVRAKRELPEGERQELLRLRKGKPAVADGARLPKKSGLGFNRSAQHRH